uniref:Uncharacterized protein n=1 Tax=Oryza rufipogon TaxID=4529 RepID=A0A0E0QQD2_ORYRU
MRRGATGDGLAVASLSALLDEKQLQRSPKPTLAEYAVRLEVPRRRPELCEHEDSEVGDLQDPPLRLRVERPGDADDCAACCSQGHINMLSRTKGEEMPQAFEYLASVHGGLMLVPSRSQQLQPPRSRNSPPWDQLGAKLDQIELIIVRYLAAY